jgi:hemolysin activation/secretion protein
LGLTVDGVTAYPQKDLAPLYSGDLTREVSMRDIVRIAQAITDKYRADGYFLSRAVVPPQASGGVVRLRVYEGYVEEVRVEGPAAPAVRRLLADVPGRKPLRLSDLDRRLTLAADLPGVRLKSQLEPDVDDPARHRLVVKTELSRISGSLYVDNRGTEGAGPWQAWGRLAANSALTPGDQLAAAVLTVPDDPQEFSQAEVSYQRPLGEGMVRLGASAARARDPSALSALVGNENRALSLRVSEPVSRGRTHSVWAGLSLDAVHVAQDWNLGERAHDDLRVLRAGLWADREWTGRSASASLQVSRGLDVFGATTKADPDRTRIAADAQFWKVSAHGSYYSDLGRIAGVYVAADGQWAASPLLGAEQFAAGALPYGRAYNYAEIAGDHGLAGLVELRLGAAPKKLKPITFLQGYAFADAAQVWRLKSPGWDSSSLASAGVGLRVTVAGKTTIRVEAARPLTRTPFVTNGKGWRAFVSLSSSF